MNNPSTASLNALVTEAKAVSDQIQKTFVKDHGITVQQIIALEKLISKSKDASDFAKKVAIWLLLKSEGLVKKVFIVIDDVATADHLMNGIHDMKSAQHTTHLNEIMQATGSEYTFSVHSGTNTHSQSGGCRVWLSSQEYDGRAEIVEFNQAAIEAIKLLPAF